MTIGSYNGWTASERRATLPLLRAAIRARIIPRPTQCTICGFKDGDDPTGRNYMTHHDERYDRLEPIEICRSCHGHLHRRFDRPRPWLRLVAKHGSGGRWFEKLSLDPSSQWRPFEETYPNGLSDE